MTGPAKATRQSADFKLDFRPPRRRHDISTEFVVTALWLMGFSAKSIGSLIELRRSQILGIVHRSGFESRSEMTDEVRQFHIDELREIRIDEAGLPLDRGALAGFDWKIRPINDQRKRRPARRGS